MTATDSKVDLPTPKLRRRSASQLLSYSQCGEAFRLERRTDAPQRPAGWFFHGTAVHEAIEAWEKSGRTTPEAELEVQYLTTYRTLVNDKLETSELTEFMTGGFKKAETDLSDREDTGWYQVQDYIQQALLMQDVWEVIDVEPYFDIVLGGVRVVGYIDQVVRNKITKQIYPADLKTGSKMPAAPVQLAIYREALKIMYPNEIVADHAFWIHLGRPPSKTGKTKAKPSRWIEEDLTDWPAERLAQWVKDMDRSESEGIYLPSPTDGCDRVCGVAQWCRAMSWHYPSVEQYAPEGWLDPVKVEKYIEPDQPELPIE